MLYWDLFRTKKHRIIIRAGSLFISQKITIPVKRRSIDTLNISGIPGWILSRYNTRIPFREFRPSNKPSDWAEMPLYKKEFYEDQLGVTEGIIKKAKNEAPVIATFYSPYACAGHTITDELLTRHLEEDPEQVKKGLEIITESLLIYVKECIRLGVDGFLQSTQGGEAGRFSDYRLFTDYVKPFDLQVGKEMEANCPCNILHICDYLGNYDDYSAFLDYPGHIINSSLQLTDRTITTKEMYALFDRPFMGGMDRKGVMAAGTQGDISLEVKQGTIRST